ncbi:MAG: cbb3-type cytochrome oxidase assembly protein CcoS [Marinobacterium sp.]|jgi:cbb3-type cytochrome oxidase maturation protein
MEIVYLLIPVAIILVAFATWAFFYSVNSGQFDDLESPAHRILYDDDEDMIPEEARIQKESDAPSTETTKD